MKGFISKIVSEVSKLSLYAVFAVMFTSQAYSVSFNCADSKTLVENMLCRDSQLSELDDQMSDSYKNLKDRSEVRHQKSIIKSQREWLKYRNKCTSESCLSMLYEERIKILNRIDLNNSAPRNSDLRANKKGMPETVRESLPSQYIDVPGAFPTQIDGKMMHAGDLYSKEVIKKYISEINSSNSITHDDIGVINITREACLNYVNSLSQAKYLVPSLYASSWHSMSLDYYKFHYPGNFSLGFDPIIGYHWPQSNILVYDDFLSDRSKIFLYGERITSELGPYAVASGYMTNNDHYVMIDNNGRIAYRNASSRGYIGLKETNYNNYKAILKYDNYFYIVYLSAHTNHARIAVEKVQSKNMKRRFCTLNVGAME